MSDVSRLTDLPLDILLLIFPYLDAQSFLNLCGTCTAFNQPDIRLDSTYWSHAARTTFRVPNHPAVESDGPRWQKLYRRLLTQSRIYTWGSNSNGCLGHTKRIGGTHVPRPGRSPRRQRYGHDSTSTLKEVNNGQSLGIVADLQCGGWSTTVLNDKGVLFTVGLLDGLRGFGQNNSELTPLRYPSAFPLSNNPYTAIQQFSSGRSHILGLADSGRIWSWFNARRAGINVKFYHTDINETGTNSQQSHSGKKRGFVRQVVAGWNKSSAYISGTGIVIWEAIHLEPNEGLEEDTYMVAETALVPKSSYLRPRGEAREPDDETRALGEEVGEITNYVVLEHYVVFATDIGKVFAGKMSWNKEGGSVPEVVELSALQAISESDPTPSATDVQGSFRSFAVFKRNGEVLTAKLEYLDNCWNLCFDSRYADPDGPQHFQKIPALQNTGVISIAFGDFHFHALHSAGHITSYGHEPTGCGALGLGGDSAAEGILRGIRYHRGSEDGQLLPHAYMNGRRVWFESEKNDWMQYMASGGVDAGEAEDRLRLATLDYEVQGELSEWFEQQGTDWDKRDGVQNADDDGLGAYFALSVAAAGWHSGALVLVNQDLAERAKQHCIIEDPAANDTSKSENEDSAAAVVVAGTLTWLYNASLSFLGLPTIDAQTQPENAQHGPGLKYIWADLPFPRLNLTKGKMPGKVEVRNWAEKPEWSFHFRGDGAGVEAFGVQGWARA